MSLAVLVFVISLMALAIVLLGLLVNASTRRPAAIFLLLAIVLIAYLYSSFGPVVRNFGGVSEFVASVAPGEPAKEVQSALSAEESSITEKAEPQRPDWVDKPGRLQGSVYRISVRSGLFVTDQECNQALPAKIHEVIEEYSNNLPGHNGTTKIPFDPEFIRQIQKAMYAETQTSSVGPMRQIYALVEFDDAARKELKGRWQATVVAGRLWRVALGSGLVLSVLAAAFGYLKLDERRLRARRATNCEPAQSGP